MIEEGAEYKARLYEVYSDERKKLDATALEIASRYDRTILTLGGGTLVLSVTFLEKIIPTPAPWTVFVLVAGWLLLLGSILSQLFALANSQRSVSKQIEWLDEDYSKYFSATNVEAAVAETALKPRPQNPYVVKTKRLNRAAEWTLAFGLLCIFAFSATNMYLRKDKANDRQEQSINTAAQTPATGTRQGGGATPSGNR